MSFRGLPLQFLNLGGEMMYIIDQRLRAQSIPQERANKVRNDILSIMLSKRFIEELFHPQALYSKCALRTVFQKLAHASIMKLNAPSMDKLFDLMMMSLKHQLCLAPTPSDLLLVTLNHLDSMADFATSTPVYDQVQMTRFYFLKLYSRLSESDWLDIRRDLLMFAQDLHTRVSIFLKTGIQDHFGRLVLATHGPVAHGCEVPGTIRFFNSSGEISLVTLFPNGGNYACAIERYSCVEDSKADRGVRLGLNIYLNPEREDNQICNTENTEEIAYQNFGTEDKEGSDNDSSGMGREELNLLAQLIGTAAQTSGNKEFRLNLFFNDSTDERRAGAAEEEEEGVIRIEGGARQSHPELGRIIGQLDMDEEVNTRPEKEQDDLLDLLDSA